MLKVILAISLIFPSPYARATSCKKDLVNAQIVKLSDGTEGVIRAYLATTIQFPLFRAPTNLIFSALFLSGRMNLKTFREAESDQRSMQKAFRTAEIAHSQIALPFKVPYEAVRAQFTSFIYHTIEPYGPTYNVLEMLHPEEFPEEWCFWGNDRVMEELFSDPLYSATIAEGKIYGETILNLLLSPKMAEISQRYRSSLKLDVPENQSAESARTQAILVEYSHEIESYLIGELEQLHPKLLEIRRGPIKTSTYIVRSMMRDWRR